MSRGLVDGNNIGCRDKTSFFFFFFPSLSEWMLRIMNDEGLDSFRFFLRRNYNSSMVYTTPEYMVYIYYMVYIRLYIVYTITSPRRSRPYSML